MMKDELKSPLSEMDSAGGQLRMVHGGHAPAGERAVQRVAGALAFHDGDELLLILLEAAQDGVGDLAIHLDVPVAGKGEGVGRFGGAGAGEMGVMGIMGVMRVRRANRAAVAEQAAEDVGEEVREQGGFLEIVGAAGSDEAGPLLEFGLPVPDDRVTWVTCVTWLHERNACDAWRGASGR